MASNYKRGGKRKTRGRCKKRQRQNERDEHQNDEKKPLSFLDLPTEIRYMIYGKLAYRGEFDIFTQPPLALVSKQIRAECLPIYFKRSTFTMTVTLGVEDEDIGNTIARLANVVENSLQGGTGYGPSSLLKKITDLIVTFHFPERNMGPWSNIIFTMSTDNYSSYWFEKDPGFDWTEEYAFHDVIRDQLQAEIESVYFWDDQTSGTEELFVYYIGSFEKILRLFAKACPDVMESIQMECDQWFRYNRPEL